MAKKNEQVRELPIKPFSEFLENQVRRHGNSNRVGTMIGMSNARVQDYREGVVRDSKTKTRKPRATVSIDVVDKSAVKAGVHISEIYPDYIDWPDLDDAA